MLRLTRFVDCHVFLARINDIIYFIIINSQDGKNQTKIIAALYKKIILLRGYRKANREKHLLRIYSEGVRRSGEFLIVFLFQ